MHQCPGQRIGGTSGRAFSSFQLRPLKRWNKPTIAGWSSLCLVYLPGAKPILVKVLRSGCGCAIETAKDCAHKLLLMLVIHKLTVLLDLVTPCTSLPCAWINPGHGVTYDVKAATQNREG